MVVTPSPTPLRTRADVASGIAPTLTYFRTNGRVAERVIVLGGKTHVDPVTDRDLLNAARNALDVLAQWREGTRP